MPAPPVVPIGAAGQPALIVLTQTATGGTWQITLDGNPTPPISGAATLTAAAILSAIQVALGQYIGTEGIAVTGVAGGPYTVSIPPNLVLPLSANGGLTLTTASLTGGSITQATSQLGFPASDAYAGSDLPTIEPPHVVGDAGQPAFATHWSTVKNTSVTMLNPPIAGALATYQPLQFYITPQGFVRIEGGVANDGSAVSGTAIFTLPAGYRPQYARAYAIPALTAPLILGLRVDANGAVVPVGTLTGAGALDVGLIEFRPVYL